jgi:putative endonuclease
VSLPNRSILCFHSFMYFVYLIKCKDGTIYTGITTDVKRRFQEHKDSRGGRYTNSRKVVKILYTEAHKNRSSALRREAQIKRWRREKKLNLTKYSEPVL